MIQTDTFVGTLAVGLAILVFGHAIKPSIVVSQLRISQSIEHRFGGGAARLFLVGVASLIFIAGLMILRDIRPGFAAPGISNSTVGRADQNR